MQQGVKMSSPKKGRGAIWMHWLAMMNFPKKGRGTSWMLWLAIMRFPLLDAMTSNNDIFQDRMKLLGALARINE